MGVKHADPPEYLVHATSAGRCTYDPTERNVVYVQRYHDTPAPGKHDRLYRGAPDSRTRECSLATEATTTRWGWDLGATKHDNH